VACVVCGYIVDGVVSPDSAALEVLVRGAHAGVDDIVVRTLPCAVVVDVVCGVFRAGGDSSEAPVLSIILYSHQHQVEY
jgi:hypothetical protein